MDDVKVRIILHRNELPRLDDSNFFHSSQLFEVAAETPRQKPYMVVAEAADGTVLGQLLGIVRYRASYFPPYFYMHCRVLGEGVYSVPSSEQSALFGRMLEALRRRLSRRVLYIEVSNLRQKMFGYREFRQLRFFPVHWMSIYNSLHSRTPEERISERMQHRIDTAYERGVTTTEVETAEDFSAFSRLLRHHNWFKPKRYIPDDAFFRRILERQAGRLYVTKLHGHVIGCSAVVYSGRNAYLWYSAFRRKSYAWVHPDVLTIWHAIKDSHRRGYDHIFFLDVGLPFSRNPFREFILSFGGKPASTYRWFHCNIGWVNRLLSWIYRD